MITLAYLNLALGLTDIAFGLMTFRPFVFICGTIGVAIFFYIYSKYKS